MAPSLFVTGVTGYVGGDFLYNVTSKHPEWHVTAIARTAEKADKVQAAFPNVKLVVGNNDSKDIIESEAAAADVVFHFADSADDEPSAKAIAAGLGKTEGHWIHTSGTMILTRPDEKWESYGKDDGEQYDDWEGIDQLTHMPNNAPHRDIDKIVLAAGSDKVKVAIVCPPTIYGPGRGPDNQKSMQAYQSAATILRNRKGFIYGEGKNVWHQIHVQDLTDLYVRLGEEAIAEESKATWNEHGYYLAENGAFAWGDVLEAITRDAYGKGLIPTTEMEQVDPAKAKGKFPMTVGTTSKGISSRGRKLLEWTPYRRRLLDEVPDIVDGEAVALQQAIKS